MYDYQRYLTPTPEPVRFPPHRELNNEEMKDLIEKQADDVMDFLAGNLENDIGYCIGCEGGIYDEQTKRNRRNKETGTGVD